ncbi:MAG: sulfotransferase [Gammaproteobacteria bacterium]|nr:sulfotransferase [Gammaproteobacteria bacterium]
MGTSTDYQRPYRPLAVSTLNAAARLTGLPGRLDVGAMVARAKRRTGLTDFGDEWFLEPLAVLVDAINTEAQLTPVGQWIQKARLTGALAKRLRVEELLRQHPEILDIDLRKIIVIASLQRTGTTTLHRLIAADPRARKLLAWEALDPLPSPARMRIRRARMAERAIAYMAPEFFAVHPIEHYAPEEDVLLLDLCFMSQSPEAVMYVPSYANWLEGQDHTKAYAYLATLLKVLHWQRPGDFWVLKTPHHAEHLDVILEVFPEAIVVQTHRDPQTIVPSFCSMVAHGRGMLSDRIDTREIAAHWTRKMRRMMELSIEARKVAPSRFVDVSYYDLLADPIAELQRIYRRADIAFDDAAVRAAENAATENARHRYGKHVYRVDDFGLTGKSVERCFAFYRREYRVPHEQS